MNIILALRQIEQLKEMVGDDERALLDNVEGSTDALEIIHKLLDAIEDDEGVSAALTEQMAVRKERRDRAEARNEKRREVIASIMGALGQPKLKLPEVTLSLRTLDAKVAVTDPAAVPDEFMRPNPKPDMKAIVDAYKPGDNLPNWLHIIPERASLSVRRR